MKGVRLYTVLLGLLLTGAMVFAELKEADLVMNLWPGSEKIENKERAETKGGITRVHDVSRPSISLYKAEDKGTPNAAVVICPGGGYSILAIDLEGTEIAEWLNSVGISAVILRYSVPGKREEAIKDAQRALGLVRYNAEKWNIDPSHIGVLGFSAGGHLSARLSNTFETRNYEKVDDADAVSCRPYFTVLVYPAYLVNKENVVSDDLKITKNTPQTFIVQTEDDGIPIEGSLFYYHALKMAGVPSELHVYAKGGHGYGMRPSDKEVSNWPRVCEKWLKGIGAIK